MFDFDYLSVDPGPFKDFLPEGSKLYTSPELPKVKSKRGNFTFEIPDLTFMHPTGGRLLEALLNKALNGEYYFDDEELFSLGAKVDFKFECPIEKYEEGSKEIKIATTIALAYRYKVVEKVGKRSNEYYGSLFMGFQKECQKKSETYITKVIFSIARDDAKTIYELGQKKKKVSMIDIIEALVISHKNSITTMYKGE